MESILVSCIASSAFWQPRGYSLQNPGNLQSQVAISPLYRQLRPTERTVGFGLYVRAINPFRRVFAAYFVIANNITILLDGRILELASVTKLSWRKRAWGLIGQLSVERSDGTVHIVAYWRPVWRAISATWFDLDSIDTLFEISQLKSERFVVDFMRSADCL